MSIDDNNTSIGSGKLKGDSGFDVPGSLATIGMMIIIDAHCHIFPTEIIASRERIARTETWFGELYRNPREKMASLEDLLSSMETAGITRSIVFGFAFQDPGLCHVCNQYVLEAAARYPGKILPFIVVQPRCKEPAQRELVDCLQSGALGLGELLPDGQGYTLEDWAILDPVMDYMRFVKRPTMFHLNEQLGHKYPGKGLHGVSLGFAFAEHYAENLLIYSHWGAGLPFYELMPEVRKTLRNVYYDTAASLYLYEDRIFSDAMNWVPDKVLWGSDFPLIAQNRFLRHINRLQLPHRDAERLLCTNAAALLRLDDNSGGQGTW